MPAEAKKEPDRAEADRAAERERNTGYRDAARATLDQLGGLTPDTKVAMPRQATTDPAGPVDAAWLINDAATYGARAWEMAGALHMAGVDRVAPDDVPALLAAFRNEPAGHPDE
jgi:hypothetical protein